VFRKLHVTSRTQLAGRLRSGSGADGPRWDDAKLEAAACAPGAWGAGWVSGLPLFWQESGRHLTPGELSCA